MISRAHFRFISRETSGAIVLLLMVFLAIVLANSALAPFYQGLLVEPLQHTVNDGLMVLFFLLVGLEIKREVKQGELSSRAQALPPTVAALGGMIVPVLIYLAITMQYSELWRGWAVPAATDIAFALGIMALLGRRVPYSLKIFLTAFAIIDDIGAVIIIGLFYTSSINGLALAGMAAVLALLYLLNRLSVSRVLPYLILGGLLWFATISAGLHGTIAGVLTALAIPLAAPEVHRRHCPLRHLEHLLHPWVLYGVLPLFALLNAGLVLEGLTLEKLAAPLPLAIMLGLFLGKQVGIFAAVYALIRMGKGMLPQGATMLQLYGTAVLGGIGFTMSQFIAGLAFPDPALANEIRLGTIGGSLLSAVWGLAVLAYATRPAPAASA